MTARARAFNPILMAGILLGGAVLLAGVFWQWTLRGIAQEIAQYQTSLKTLQLSGRVPPNREVMAYLTQRGEQLHASYRQAMAVVAPAAGRLAVGADPQLAFQERVHEVQRTLERLTTARGMSIPLELGLPKELPPPDSVPRFLMQLALMEGLAELAMTVDGVSQLTSFQVEDPRPIAADAREGAPIVMELPVQMHVTCSLSALMQLLRQIERAQPVMALQRIQVLSSSSAATPAAGPLDVELIVARYATIDG
jgi:hypothetical protein